MLMKTLKAQGHTCEEAENGQVALGMVQEKDLATYDAVLMDFVMVFPRPRLLPRSPFLPSIHYCSHVPFHLCFLVLACDGRP